MRSRGLFKESLTNLLENRKQRAILIGECSSSVSIDITVPRGFFERSQDNIFGAEWRNPGKLNSPGKLWYLI